MLDLHAQHAVLFVQHLVQLVKQLRDPFEKIKLCAQLAQIVVRWPVHVQVVQHALQVGQFAIVAFLVHQFPAALPELFGIDPEVGEERLILHVRRAECLVVIVNNADGGLLGCHGELTLVDKDLNNRQQL